MTTKRKPPERATGWTMAREIFGSFIGVLPFVIGVGSYFVYQERSNTERDKDIAYLKQADAQQEEARKEWRAEINRRLERLERKTEHLPAWGGQVRQAPR